MDGSPYRDRGDWRNAAHGYRDQRDALHTQMDACSAELEQLRALATAVENYLSGGMSTVGLRELYAAWEALRRG